MYNSVFSVNYIPERVNIMERKSTNEKAMKKIKIVYAVAVMLAIGGAAFAKYSTEKALKAALTPQTTENRAVLSLPYESIKGSENNENPVLGDVTNVPDTRTEVTLPRESEAKVEESNESSPYAMPYSEEFVMPVKGEVIKEFSDGAPVFSKTMNDWRAHTGVDIAAEEGEQVRAVAYGTVSAVDTDTLYGTSVTLDHGNGLLITYSGLDRETLAVKKGATVEAGDGLGYILSVPCESADGTHLHLEAIYDGKKANPLEIMGK